MEANAECGAVKLFTSKRRVAAAAAVLLLGLFLWRPGVSRLKTRIINSISRAVGRSVDVGQVHLQFLPRPGFDLENLIIYEDAAFGSEPMLRAQEVTAVVRLTSLLRGRLDIARLELTEPSLNLVRRADGRWNLEDLLERNQRTPLAPTAKSKSEARPGFPYIEATSGRINFKAGQEKKAYALLNADFSLWQESENMWGARLKAEPLRTDMNLSDTGLLRLSGTWQRAGSLRETPLQFNVEWDGAQLGQLSKLLSGSDKGWRGEVTVDATLSGIPTAMQVAMDTSIGDFHRYDIPSGDALRLTAHCDGSYSSVEAMAHAIVCRAPVGEGMITLRGDAGVPGVHKIDLALSLENVPVSSVAQLARRVKKDLPADLVSSGAVQGSFAVKEEPMSAAGAEFQGRGEITNLRLVSANTKVEFAAASIPFVLKSGRAEVHDRFTSKQPQKPGMDSLPAPADLRVEYGPFPVAMGRPLPAQAQGWIARSGYRMAIHGEGEVSHTLRLASLLGLPAVKASVEGGAQMELQMAGSWAGNVSGTSSNFSPPTVTGTAQLRNVRARVRGLNDSIEITSAELQLLPEEVRLDKLSARAASAVWNGALSLPRGCGTPTACVVHFNVSAQEIGLDEISQSLSAQAKRPWYQRLTSAEAATTTFLEELRASGKVSVNRLRIRGLVAKQVSGTLDLDRGKVKITRLQADVFGGKYRGDWQADFVAGAPPSYAGAGTLTGVVLQQVADAMHDPWISGTADGTYQLTASGANLAAFWQSAECVMQFDVRDGSLPHISLASDSIPLGVKHWRGHARLQGGKIEIDKSKIISPAGVYQISGSASLGKVLDIRLTQESETKASGAGTLVYSITGTVAEPHVALTPAPETQAQLKP